MYLLLICLETYFKKVHYPRYIMANKKVTPLSDTDIRNAKPKEKDYTIADGNGLQLTIKADGKKIWEIRYTLNGKPKKTTAGNYPAVSLKDARAKRNEIKAKVREGIDPVQEKREAKEMLKAAEEESLNTFKKCATDYFALIEHNVSEKHYKKQWGRINNNFHPFIGDKNIRDITYEEILKCVLWIQDRGSIQEAHKNLALVKQVFDYAVANRRCERNTARDISTRYSLKAFERKHYPTITDTKKLGAFLRAIDKHSGEYAVRCALQIAPYLALRPENIRTMEWTEIDFEKATLTISAEKMKMNREHIVPLVPQVLAILKELQKLNGDGQYCFHTQGKGSRSISDGTMNKAIKNMGYTRADIVPHGFRAMFTTIANERMEEHGCNSDVIEKCTAHEHGNKVRAAYNRAQYWSQRVKLMQWWADYLDSVKVSGAEQ